MQIYNHRLTVRLSDNEMKSLKGLEKRNHTKKSKILKNLIDSIPDSMILNRLIKLNKITNNINNNLANIEETQTSKYNILANKLDKILNLISKRDNNLNQMTRRINSSADFHLDINYNNTLKALNAYRNDDRRYYNKIQDYNSQIIKYLASIHKEVISHV